MAEPIERWTDERLDLLALATQNLLEATEANTTSNERIQKGLDRLVEAQLSLTVLHGQLAEQTLQMKRTIDYLLSKDGENAG